MTEITRESIEAVLRWQPKHLPGRHDQMTHGSWSHKQPWQMTKAEFLSRRQVNVMENVPLTRAQRKIENELAIGLGRVPRSTATFYGYNIEAQHRKMVEEALREGKPVPPEVLADYPDLVR